MRFEQAVRYPTCEETGYRLSEKFGGHSVANAEGIEASLGESPFVIVPGNQLERLLLYNDAELMPEAPTREEVLPPRSEYFAEFRIEWWEAHYGSRRGNR